MRHVHDPDFPFPPLVEKGEMFVFLSDEDVWDTPHGCSIAVFQQEYRGDKPYEPYSIGHEELMRATLEGQVRWLELPEVIAFYLRAHPEIMSPKRSDGETSWW